ncbi:hypothetical protein [Martelella mediterranea]|uniref:Heme exporter protein D n=1 Tax=Martelella mediterranea TaxID=293089 RepID=A0A4R3NXH9_9HYPH|nr:hypothetical protein [Martelella mediterranea]TCT37666.1 hypothetical protein EDC90_101756 [Martelella mediterranea]
MIRSLLSALSAPVAPGIAFWMILTALLLIWWVTTAAWRKAHAEQKRRISKNEEDNPYYRDAGEDV